MPKSKALELVINEYHAVLNQATNKQTVNQLKKQECEQIHKRSKLYGGMQILKMNENNGKANITATS